MYKSVMAFVAGCLCIVSAFAQPVKDGEPVNGVSYKSIGAFQNATQADKVVFILDTIRGGAFIQYTGTLPADAGLIIQNANGKKYIRQLTGNEVNLLWWGARAEDLAFDNRPAFLACLNALQNIAQDATWSKNPYFLKQYRIYIPGASKKYFISGDSLLINHTVRIEGDAGYTRLLFAKKGFCFAYPGAAGSSMYGISLFGNISYKNPDTTWYGIRVKCLVDFREITIRQFYNGLEVLADAAVKPTHPMYGNSNNSTFRQIRCVLNGGNGIYVKGGDANNISFEQVDVVSNTLWGVNDQNFLGNTYTMGHAASNASPELPYNITVAVRKGVLYAATRNGYLPDPSLPGSEASWWRWADSATLYQPYPFPYNPRKYYRAGGAYNLDGENLTGENQRSALLNCYAEADQPASYVGQSSYVLGGNHGTGVRKGAYLGAYNHHLYSTSKISVGMEGANRAGIIDSHYIRIQQGFTEGIGLSYDPQTKVGTLGYPAYVAAFQNILFTTPQTSSRLLNRNGSAERNVIVPYGLYMGEMGNTSDYRRLFRSRNKPDTGQLENGDVVFARHQSPADSPDDLFAFTKNATGTVIGFKGFAEYEGTTNDAKPLLISTETLSNGNSMAYECIATAQTGTGALYYCRKEILLTRSYTGAVTVALPVRDVTPEHRGGGMGRGVQLSLVPTATGMTITAIGEAGKTIRWKIQVKRI
jgi:hypothetical protein